MITILTLNEVHEGNTGPDLKIGDTLIIADPQTQLAEIRMGHRDSVTLLALDDISGWIEMQINPTAIPPVVLAEICSRLNF